MKMVRDLGPIDRFPYLVGLGFAPDDLGRIAVAAGRVAEPGLYVEAATGESRLLVEGEPVPAGVWVAQRAIDDLKPDGGVDLGGRHGFGEGWGRQGPQLGGDRSIPEEDAGGTIRDTPNHEEAGGDASATP